VPAVHFRSLGCPKNQLDTEVMLGSLALAGYQIAEDLADADVAVVNTCSFIETAREESIEAILELADHREKGRLRALVVAGCLPQRYGRELAKELPEVDAFIGTAAFPEIPKILDDALAGKSRGVYVEAGRTHLYDDASPRVLIGPGHSAYVKIAEGCDRICAFCAIPGIRGKFQSRTQGSLVRELEQLAQAGVREVNLVAQDSTSWGKDQPGRPKLAELVRALDAVEGLDWIRFLYLYPSAVDDALIESFGTAKRVLPYVDVPLQHASDAMLRAMRRGTTAARQRKLIERLRAGIPNLTLRTTVIVGFPGETDADFEALCDFAREVRFDRLGVFRYSDEEGTAGKDLPDKVARSTSRARYKKLTALQARIMADALAAQVGREADVLVDAVLGRDRAIGRFASQAPEIDGVTHLATKAKRTPGAMVRARVTGVRAGVDLEAAEL
jgi:ribosomal protein S12 methylthiotransferase